jgi:hypothetical protein
MLIGFSRLVMVNADGTGQRSLSGADTGRARGIRQNGGDVIAYAVDSRPGKVLMTREYVAEADTATRTVNTDNGLGVVELDVETLRERRIESPDKDAVGYLADETGTVRIMIRHPLDTLGRLGPKRMYSYRARSGGSWRQLGEVEVDAQTRSGFVPVAVDAASDRAIGFVTREGYDTLVAVPLDGSGANQVLAARNDVDVDQLIRIGRRNRVVGASFATEKRQVEYFDPQLASLAKGLQAALPGKPLINIVDASEDESKLLIIASSDVDPGMTYFYDKSTRQLSELLPMRDPLVGRAMGAMSARVEFDDEVGLHPHRIGHLVECRARG